VKPFRGLTAAVGLLLAVSLTGCAHSASTSATPAQVVPYEALPAVGCTITSGSSGGQIVIANTFRNASKTSTVVLQSARLVHARHLTLLDRGVYLGRDKDMDMLPLPLDSTRLKAAWKAHLPIHDLKLKPKQVIEVGIAVRLPAGSVLGTTDVFQLRYTTQHDTRTVSGLERYKVGLKHCPN
jgi:hypothetical protein